MCGDNGRIRSRGGRVNDILAIPYLMPVLKVVFIVVLIGVLIGFFRRGV